MRYDFSAGFLRILPPDTSFGEAWESLCEILLRKELGATNLTRFRSPDCGVDMLYRPENKAFQCKSSERGVYGTIDAEESAKSLETAIRHKPALEWIKYCFATNANYTGAGYKKIMLRAKGKGLVSQDLEFLGPAYWDQLCIAYPDLVEERFDYRVTVPEKHLLEALQIQVPRLISEVSSSLTERTRKSIVISNNLTQVEIELPLLTHLSVENYLKATIELLGLSELVNSSFGIALMPLFSLRFRGRELSPSVSLDALAIRSGDELVFHTKLSDDALAVFDEIIVRLPDNPIAQTSRAGILMSHGRLDEALTAYEKIIAAHPEDLAAKLGRAEVLKAFGRFSDALDAFDTIIAAHPEDVVAKNGRAEVLKDQGQLQEALSVYDESVVRHSPDSVSADHPEKEVKRTDKSGTKPGAWREQVAWNIERLIQDTIWNAAERLRFLEDNPDTVNLHESTILAAAEVSQTFEDALDGIEAVSSVEMLGPGVAQFGISEIAPTDSVFG